jgi:hypothetical protein
MPSKPWYVPTDRWETSRTPEISALPDFERHLARIVATADTDAQSQQRLTLELVREVNQIRWILVWLLILIPVILVTMTIVLAVAANVGTPSASVPTLDDY